MVINKVNQIMPNMCTVFHIKFGADNFSLLTCGPNGIDRLMELSYLWHGRFKRPGLQVQFIIPPHGGIFTLMRCYFLVLTQDKRWTVW